MPFPHQMKRKIGKIKVEINFIRSTIKLILLINIMILYKTHHIKLHYLIKILLNIDINRNYIVMIYMEQLNCGRYC